MDRRRVNGPELSVAPLLMEEQTPKEILDNEGKRLDERGLEDLRPIFLKPGLVTQANGSAYIEVGKTKVACAVYGPRQVKKLAQFSPNGIINCDFKFSPFARTKRRSATRDPEEKEFSQILIQALSPAVRLELLPKSTIDIYINVLESDGISSSLAAAIVAASVALADAGIEMLDQVTACSGVFAQDKILMDGTEKEESKKEGSLVLSYMPSINEVTYILQVGRSDSLVTSKAMEQCIDGCSKIYSVMSNALLKSL